MLNSEICDHTNGFAGARGDCKTLSIQQSAPAEIALWEEHGSRENLSPKMGYIKLSPGRNPPWAEQDLGSEACVLSDFLATMQFYEPEDGTEIGAFARAEQDLKKSFPLANGDQQSKLRVKKVT